MNNDKSNGFECDNCHKWVVINDFIGTKNRNHCPFCLWSKHVDDQVSGDRESTCQGGMKPVGLTFKQVGNDKYGQPKLGELMLIHICTKCGKVSINRIAADDDTELILELLRVENISQDDKQLIEAARIKILSPSDESQVRTLLFGKTN